MKRNWLILTMAVLVVVAVPARVAQANAGEDFWKAYSLWVKITQDMNTQLTQEAKAAEQEKRAPRNLPITDATYHEYLAQVGTGAGWQPMITAAKVTQIRFWLANISLDHKVEDLEPALRELWKQGYKPDRTTDYAALYTRYMAERKYAEAVRIAKECTREYSWIWNVRDWQDLDITAMSNDPRFRSQMAAQIIDFCEAHRNEIGANDQLLRYLVYLERAELWSVAARVSDTCVRSYQDSDWEPAFLVRALNACRHLLLPPPPAPKDAKPEIPPTPAAPKPGAPPGLPGIAKAPAVPARVDPTRRLLELSARCVKRCPYNPETAAALLEFFTWTQQDDAAKGPLRDGAARLVATYLTDSKKSPEWSRFWRAGKGLVEAGDAQWVALAEEAKAEEIDEPAREIKLKEALAPESLTNQSVDVDMLVKTAGAFPETIQAQKIISNLVTQVMSVDRQLAATTNIPPVATAIRRLFPRNPVYCSLQLQRLGAITLPAATDIFTGLISRSTLPLQTEWYYYMNHRRFMGQGAYNLAEFEKYATKCRGSYYLPGELYGVCIQAVYNGRPNDACRATEILTDKLYANSYWVANMFASNIGVWSPYTIANEAQAAAADTKHPKHVAKSSGGSESARAHADICEQQGNMIDQAQGDKVDLGQLYYYTMVGGNKINFRAHAGQTAKRILQSADYRDTFWYFYARAYEK